MIKSTTGKVNSNLLNNAIEAILSTTTREKNIHVALTYDQQSQINIKIDDNGCGIPESTIPSIMRGGITSKPDGSGLGLSTSVKLVESWGGNIKIESQVNKGTCVSIILPSTPAPSWFSAKINFPENVTLLILDDDQSIHSVWNKRFSTLSFSDYNIIVQHFTKAEEFCNYVESHKNDQMYCLVDYMLKERSTSGLDIIKQLKIADISLLVTSSYRDKVIRERADALNLKILPKTLANVVPIQIVNCYADFIS